MVYFGNFGFVAPSQSHSYLSFISRVISLGLDEFVTLGETLSTGKYVSVYSGDTIVLSELLENIVARVRNLAETIQIEQGGFIGDDFVEDDFDIDWEVTRIVTKYKTITQSISISDLVTIITPRFRTLAETINVSEALTMVRTKARSLTQSITVGDTLTRAIVKLRSFMSVEAVTISESVTAAKVKGKALAETITIGDTLTRLSLKIKALADTITLGATLTRASIKARAPGFPEAVTIGETLTKIKLGVKALADSITVSEALTRISAKTRSLADTITIAGSPVIGKFKSIFINEIPISVAEQAIPTFIKKAVKNLSETITVSDAVTRSKKTIRSLAQSIVISDLATSAQIIARNIAETITIGDTLTRVKSRILSLSQSIGLSDSVARTRLFVKNLAESLSISDAISLIKTRGLLILQTINISDFVTAIRLPSGAPRWVIAGQVADFQDTVENLVKAYVNSNWSISTPALGTNTASQGQIDNFAYDGFRTYYLKIKEIASDVNTRQIRLNMYEFETPVQFDIYSRRLSKGEAFNQINDIINELMRIFGTFQHEAIFGIQGILFDRITAMEMEHSAAQSVWCRRLTIRLIYYKVSVIG